MSQKVSLFIFSLFFITIFLTNTSVARAVEQIDAFTVFYTLEQDTSLQVIEVINYYTSSAKHGIFRYLPVTYDRRQSTPITWTQVTVDGQSHPFSVRGSDGKSLAQIGDPDQTFSGSRTYTLSYQAQFAVEPGTNELYWDIVGEDWDFPVSSISAIIHSPFAPIVEADCWSGQFGGNDHLCQIQIVNSNTAAVSYPAVITKGENVTFSLKLAPNNSLIYPTAISRLTNFVVRHLIVITLVLVVIAIIIAITWWRRDHIYVNDQQLTLEPSGPTKKRPFFYRLPTAFWYEPFPNLSPMQAGLILEKRFLTPSRFIVAEIIQLVQKKYLSLEKADKTLFTGQNYIFTKLKPADNELTLYQRLIFNEIFFHHHKITLREIKKNESFKILPDIRRALNKSLVDQKLIIDPHSFNLDVITQGTVLCLSIFVGLIIFLSFTHNIGDVPLWSPLIFFGGVILFCVLAGAVKLTARGNHYRYLIQGLKTNLKLGKWRSEIQEKMLYVEQVLPFAIALGVVDRLARDLKELGLDKVESGSDLSSQLVGFSLLSSGFVSSFTHDFHSVYASQTGSGSGSSGGGGGGGGGSSGGGGGGGGGGSW